MLANTLMISGLIIVAVPAAAQQNTMHNGLFNCTTTSSPTIGGVTRGIDPNAFRRGYNQTKGAVDSVTNAYRRSEGDNALREQALAAARQADQAQAQAPATMDQQAAAKLLGVNAGQMISAGDCVGAQRLALDAGVFDLANAVKSYCAK